MPTKKPSLGNYVGQFPANVAIVLLTASLIIELFSIIGWLSGITSVLPHPTGMIMSFLSIIVSFLGAYGLYRKRTAGIYLTLLASVFLMILGGFAFIKAYNMAQMNQVSTITATTMLFLGLFIVLSVFKISFKHMEMASAAKDTSLPSDSENASTAENRYTIETTSVEKKYFLGPNVVSAINGVTMRIRKGEFVAIMGPSGSGKSTLLNLLGALDKPSSGRVLIDGTDISLLNETSLARLRNEKIGFVFQAYNLIARSSVLRNMELPALVKGYSREERLRIITNLLTIVGLSDKLLRKPKTLSGGEQQRVAIARALVNEPEILLADEPTGNVDSKQGLIIMSFLRKLNTEKKATIIVVTHDPEVARVADRIVYLRDGRIAEEERIGGLSA
jgi:putative ABC transport system ATP-binding protein